MVLCDVPLVLVGIPLVYHLYNLQVEEGCKNDGLDLEGGGVAPNSPPENKNNNESDPDLCYDDLGQTVFDDLTDPVYAADDAPCLSQVLAIMFAWITPAIRAEHVAQLEQWHELTARHAQATQVVLP